MTEQQQGAAPSVTYPKCLGLQMCTYSKSEAFQSIMLREDLHHNNLLLIKILEYLHHIILVLKTA